MKSAEYAHECRRLTPRQLEILIYVRDYRRSHGYSPTMQELADSLRITKVTVFEHVGALEKKGLLRRLPHKARSLELTDQVEFPDEVAAGIPLVGHIAAGRPIEAIENRELVELQDMFPAREGTFLLRVRGDSMIDEQIRDGDYVVVEKRNRVKDGDVVVALLEDGDATLKKLYRDKTRNRYRLQPANPEFEPTFVDRLDVQGVVVGVLRKFG